MMRTDYIEAAIDYPEKVARVVVIGSSPIKARSIFHPMPLDGTGTYEITTAVIAPA
ncbi:MAG: hypothetical protein O7B35_02955 [Deltaproteobacteria bacterium]|nr:hypothetical protein [Deltaproteobacteria bacterium]